MIRRLIIGTLLAVLSVLAVSRIHPDASLENLFSKDDRAAQALGSVLNNFASVEELLILATTIRNGPDPAGLTDFGQQLQLAIQHDPQANQMCASVAWKVDGQTQKFFEHVVVPNGLFYLDDRAFAAAKERLTKDEMLRQIHRNEAMMQSPGPAAQALSKVLLKDPLRLHEFLLDRLTASRPFQTYDNSGAFLSRGGRSLLIRLRGTRPVNDIEFAKSFTAKIESLARQTNTQHFTLDFSGAYPIAAASERAIRGDLTSNVIYSIVALQVFFILVYRRPFRVFLLAILPVALGILYGFGVYSFFSTTLTPMTAVIGGILAGMGIDYSIQYLSQYQSRRISALPVEAAQQTSRAIRGPISAAWATSIVGFLAIASSHVHVLRDFSLLGILGLTGAFFAVIFLLPALLVVTDRRNSQSPFRLPIEPLLRFVDRFPKSLIAIAVALSLGAVAVLIARGAIPKLESDLTVMHPRPNAPLDAQYKIAKVMGMSPGSVIVYLHASDPSQLLVLAHDVEAKLQAADVQNAGITGTFGLATLLPDPRLAPQRVAATGEQYAQRVVRDFNSAIADSIFSPEAYHPYAKFLHELLTRTAPPGINDLLAYPSLADNILPKSAFAKHDPTEAITLVFVKGNTEDRAVRDRAVTAIRGALRDLPQATPTGLSVVGADVEQRVRQELPRLVVIALSLVALYLALYFRDLRYSTLSILPTIVSLLILLAAMQLLGEKLNMINLVAFPLLIGIDVDYGIFLVSALRRREQIAPSTHAVVLCAIATGLGFASLMLTSIPAVRSLGLCVAIGIGACLLTCLFVVLPLSSIQTKTK